jgi:hypothetical protein
MNDGDLLVHVPKSFEELLVSKVCRRFCKRYKKKRETETKLISTFEDVHVEHIDCAKADKFVSLIALVWLTFCFGVVRPKKKKKRKEMQNEKRTYFGTDVNEKRFDVQKQFSFQFFVLGDFDQLEKAVKVLLDAVLKDATVQDLSFQAIEELFDLPKFFLVAIISCRVTLDCFHHSGKRKMSKESKQTNKGKKEKNKTKEIFLWQKDGFVLTVCMC